LKSSKATTASDGPLPSTPRAYLFSLVHLSIRLPFVLENRVPAYPMDQYGDLSKQHRIGNIPKFGGPLAGTIFPLVRPWNKIGSCPGPAQYAKVHTAKAVLSSYAASMLFSPS
jgi:hypothetical protein